MGKLKVLFIILALFFVALVFSFGYYIYPLIFSSPAQSVSAQTSPSQVISITEESFPLYISSTNFVKDLPKSALISLKTSKKEYIITKASVKEGQADSRCHLDIILGHTLSF